MMLASSNPIHPGLPHSSFIDDLPISNGPSSSSSSSSSSSPPAGPDSTRTIQFESPTHTSILLAGLNTLRKKGLLVDITLVAGGQAFEAHRVVLSSCSDYFRAMFTTEVKESRQKIVRLEGVSAMGLHFLLDYAYTSRLLLSLTNIQDILSAASHVQLINVVEACSNYLQNQLDLDNCVDITTLAETYSLHQLKKRVYKFMSGHLMEFSQTPDFQRLSPSQMAYLLDCDYPVDCPESEVLRIVLQWIDYDDEGRIGFGVELLKKVHYDKICPDILEHLWDHQHHQLLPFASSQCETLYKMIVTQLYSAAAQLADSAPDKTSSSRNGSTTPAANGSAAVGLNTNLVNSRGMELAIVKVGGFGISGVTNEVTYYLASVGKWKRLTTIPHVEQCNFGIAVLQNRLYVVGGCFNQYLQENIHPFGFCFDPRFNKWTTLAPMLTERCRFTLNVVGDKLYAIGGASENVEDLPNPDEFCPCECYDPEEDTWLNITPLSSARTQHAGTSWAHLLFISGGLEQEVVSSSLMCYDTTKNSWESKAPMLNARADHSMISYQDTLLTIGGWYEDETLGNRALVPTIDEYNVSTNSWRILTVIPTPRFHAGICLARHKIFIIGGFHSEATFDRTTGVIECYDLIECQWSTAERYPEDIWEHCCATLYIPKSREDMDVVPEIR